MGDKSYDNILKGGENMFDDKLLICKGGIIMLLPATPCLGLMAVGAVAIGAGIYCLYQMADEEVLLDWDE